MIKRPENARHNTKNTITHPPTVHATEPLWMYRPWTFLRKHVRMEIKSQNKRPLSLGVSNRDSVRDLSSSKQHYPKPSPSYESEEDSDCLNDTFFVKPNIDNAPDG